MGLLDRLKTRLTRTRAALSDSISGLFRGGRPIDSDLLAELEEVLYTADLGPLATELVEEIERRHRRGELKGEDDVRAALRERLRPRLDAGGELTLQDSGPTVILVVGVNGSGKTTSIAKIAHRFRQQGKRVLLGAGDTFRAAAADQLEIWAERNGAEIVRQHQDGADPAAVAFDAVSAAVAAERGAAVLRECGGGGHGLRRGRRVRGGHDGERRAAGARSVQPVGRRGGGRARLLRVRQVRGAAAERRRHVHVRDDGDADGRRGRVRGQLRVRRVQIGRAHV